MRLLRVLVRGQPAKSLSVRLRLPPAHEEEWVKCQKGIRLEDERMGKERIYHLLCQMAKVEL
jgi:hypothetical protein